MYDSRTTRPGEIEEICGAEQELRTIPNITRTALRMNTQDGPFRAGKVTRYIQGYIRWCLEDDLDA